MDSSLAIDTENLDLPGNRIKGKGVAKGSIVGNVPRKKLADISNMPPPNHDTRLQSCSPKTKEYIHKLHQETASLHKHLSKTIQLQTIEIHNLRTICQQLQQKNLQLAQTHSQMLEELNSAKDRLKVLQHELGCKNGLLTARNLECKVEPTGCYKAGKSSRTDNKNNEPRNKKRMRQSLENNSVKPVQVQEKIDERRKSARFKVVEQVPTDNLLEISGTQGHLADKSTQHQNKVDEKRCRSRSQFSRFEVGEEEPTAMVKRSDALDPTTVKLVPAEHLSDNETKCSNKVDDKRCHSRRQSTRLKVEEQPTATVESSATLEATNELVRAEKKIEDKRLCTRRQSARFTHQEQVQQPTGDSSQTDDVKVPVSPPHECDPAAAVESSDALDTTNELVRVEKKIDDKRLCARRQSARFKHQEQVQEPTGDLSAIDDVKVPAFPLHECDPTSTLITNSETSDCVLESKVSELPRTSIRPKREAAVKVQSYKERPIHIKMRREG